MGTLFPEMFGTLSDDTASGLTSIDVDPYRLDLDGHADVVSISLYYRPKIAKTSLHLLGIGWQYTNFRRLHGTRFPWPSVGVSGEGVYGYFDGSAKSRSVQVLVEEDG